ncbi:MAG: toprim domain-containing protein [Actinomycetota bacterium]|nr:toprim domain-containing protein [Actinomycetota bacterium]
MGGYQRDEVLARTDLAALATDVLGPPTGFGRTAKWHCPDPDHPDTHPSMNIYDGVRSQRWKCHACGEGGTAIDLWMLSQRTTVGEAIAALGERAGLALPAGDGPGPRLKHLLTAAPPTPPPVATGPPPGTVDLDSFDVRVESYVTAAADLLWGHRGGGALAWLHQRGFSDAVLRANRVGYDPGPKDLRRPKGMPRRGTGIVFPILGSRDHAIWAQTRYFDPTGAGRKYDSVVTEIAPNPRLATIRTPGPAPTGVVVITEGIPDGLTVAHSGVHAVAVVGTANTGPDVARRLHDTYPHATFVIAFDNDNAGLTTGPKLGAHLAQLGSHVVATTPAPHNDLNDWWQADPAGLTEHLAATARPALYQPDASLRIPVPEL